MHITPLMRSIIEAVERNGGVLQGTHQLATLINSAKSKTDVLNAARKLQEHGLITIYFSLGGRGKRTVYKRNRNSPGQARKKKYV